MTKNEDRESSRSDLQNFDNNIIAVGTKKFTKSSI